MEALFQLVALTLVIVAGPAVIILLAARKGNLSFFLFITYEY